MWGPPGDLPEHARVGRHPSLLFSSICPIAPAGWADLAIRPHTREVGETNISPINPSVWSQGLLQGMVRSSRISAIGITSVQ